MSDRLGRTRARAWRFVLAALAGGALATAQRPARCAGTSAPAYGCTSSTAASSSRIRDAIV